MSKNLTRKGLAFGALVALGASVIAGAPANAAGLADTSFVSLAPATGTDYAVIAGAGKTFSLAANEASTLTVGNIKFLVADSSALINPTVLVSALAQTAIVRSSAGVVTVNTASTPLAGQKITISTDVVAATPATVVPAGVYTVGTVSAGASFTLAETLTATPLTGAGSTAVDITVQGARALDSSYVVDSGTSSSTTSSNLVLKSDSEVTRSVVVTAWKDANANDKIDDTEYASPARTVTFVKASELVTSTSLSPVVGDLKLTAKVTTTPVLNGVQVLTQNVNAINAAFTRQDSTATLFSNAGAPAVWNDTTKAFTVEVSTVAGPTTAGGSVIAAVSGAVSTASVWTGLTTPATTTTSTVVAATGVATTTTNIAHNLRVGDIVSWAGGLVAATGATATETVVSVPSATTFTWASSLRTALTTGNTTAYTATTWGAGLGVVDAVFAGAYTAQAYVNGVASGSKTTAGTVAVAVATATLSTTASASIGSISAADATANTAQIKTGTTSVPMVLTALDADEAAVTAGRPVVITAGTLVTGTAAAVGTFKINGLASPQTLYTDAAGKVAFTVTETAGAATAQVRISAVVEGSVTVGADLVWNDADYGLVDFNTVGSTVILKRAILKGSSYTLKLAVLDQWFQAPAAGKYNLYVNGSGSAERFVTLTDGKADVVIADSGVTAVGGSFTTNVTLQTLNTAGTVTASAANAIVTTLVAAPAVVLGASGSTLYGSAVTTTSAVAAKALVAIDHRTSFATTPAYVNSVNLNGAVQSATTSQAVVGAVVSVSGAANLLFKSGQVEKLGSIELLSADSDGKFEFQVYSTSAVTDSVITVTSNGVSKTIKVSFTGIGVGEGTALVVTAPATALPASTFQISAKLADAFGNGVAVAAATPARIKVTHSGPGIVYGTLPTSTDANGALSFSVLLGAADVGNAVFTVSYDQNGDGDFVDAKDLTSAKTVVIGAASVLNVNASVAGIVGYVATTVRNASGKAVTVTVNGRVLTPRAPNVAAQLFRFRAKAGKTTVVVKVDGVTVSSRTVSVK